MSTPPQVRQTSAISVLYAAPRRTALTWVFLAISALALTIFAVGLARAALVACGINVFGLQRSNCVERWPPPPTRDDQQTVTLKAEAEHLGRTLDQLRRQLAARPVCPAAPAQREAQAPALTDQAWQSRSVEALQGCWVLSSDYRLHNEVTNIVTTVTSWQLCFDSQGRGSQEIRQSDGAECRAPLTATFPDAQTLQILEEEGVRCSDNTQIFKREIRCEKSSAAAVNCSIYQPERQSRVTASLRRQ
jgi:hypothetical protein